MSEAQEFYTKENFPPDPMHYLNDTNFALETKSEAVALIAKEYDVVKLKEKDKGKHTQEYFACAFRGLLPIIPYTKEYEDAVSEAIIYRRPYWSDLSRGSAKQHPDRNKLLAFFALFEQSVSIEKAFEVTGATEKMYYAVGRQSWEPCGKTGSILYC